MIKSGVKWIDELISLNGYRIDQNIRSSNILTYSFDANHYIPADYWSGAQRYVYEFSEYDQYYTRMAFDYIESVTGINFVEVKGDGDIDLGYSYLSNGIGGECSYNYDVNDNAFDSTILINKNYTFDLAPGHYGYEVLLHELGHSLGLVHPHDGIVIDNYNMYATEKHDSTIMAYSNIDREYSDIYHRNDIAALWYIYGNDGIGGDYGYDEAARLIVGTEGNDVFDYDLTNTPGREIYYGMEGLDRIESDKLMSAFEINRISDTMVEFVEVGKGYVSDIWIQ
jgi:hypothetical protein